MIQSRNSFRFSLKPTQARIIRSKVSRQYFQSDEAIKPGILRQIDFTHASATQPLDDRVRSNLVSNLVSHITADKYVRIL